ncbi:MAG: hypothetical protein PHQ90_07275 [Sulfuricurvum sp.]|nr:hypothetical protein [Sulfuricurvum sp.]MDD2369089.1 hypothetical protein [Sulfuricurvum sp.]MDD5117103.1 hypothetical protein [Sulfuricurvum sp.]
MTRIVVLSVLAILMLGGCTAKEFNSGVDDGVNDVKRVIRGTNN